MGKRLSFIITSGQIRSDQIRLDYIIKIIRGSRKLKFKLIKQPQNVLFIGCFLFFSFTGVASLQIADRLADLNMI